MRNPRPQIILTYIVAAALAASTSGSADQTSKPVTITQIAAAIERHIAARSREQGGFYHLEHEGKVLKLRLVRIHMEYLADLGGGVQFACVDLVGTDGPVYDVDFFLKGRPGSLTVTESTVHKVNGQPLYAWEQKQDNTWARVPVKDAGPRLLGVLQGEDSFEFVYRVMLPKIASSAKMWLPLARSDDHQTVELVNVRAPAPHRTLTDGKHGNRVLYMALEKEHSGKDVEIRYRVRRVELSPYPAGPSDARSALAPEKMVPSDRRFRTIAEQAIRGKRTDLMRARALYDYVIDQVRYARYGSGWGKGDAVYACDAKSGNCTDFHALFIALARSVNIPARFAIGAAIPSERNEGGIDGYHCWAEFYADGQWWPVDISEADKYSSLATWYFGHQPANRFELSRGRDLVVHPGPKSGPINFLAYPVLEVNGKPTKATTEFTFVRTVKTTGTIRTEAGGTQ